MVPRRLHCWLLLALFSHGASANGDQHCYSRCPIGAALQALHNPGFSIGYDTALRQARWVAFKALPLPKHRKPWWRHGRFAADPRLSTPVTQWGYRGTGYDRGHLGPAFLLGALYGEAASEASYWMSNISPQKPSLNRLLMQRLEEAESHRIASTRGGVWVLSGPLFSATPMRTKSGVAIPDAFYRIWLNVGETNSARACAFIFPQEVAGLEPLSQFASTVDAIEAASGLDFFSGLSQREQQRLESTGPDKLWPLAEIANWPARYGQVKPQQGD